MHRDVNAIGGSARINGPAIQAQEVSGGIHIRTGEGIPLPVPRQLLPVHPYFTDRAADLSALRGLFAQRPEDSAPVIVVSGSAGIGKTALVSRWLGAMESSFPDGQLYADLRAHAPEGPAAPGEILGQFLRALGVTSVPDELAEQAALWRSLTAGRRVAVMLDNAFSAAQTRPLVPGGPHSLVVATSRYRLTGLHTDGALYHQLGLLEPSAAEELLSRGVGTDRVRSEATAAREVVTLCAGLPLAVCLASARLASRPRQPVQVMADALAREQRRLAVLSIEGEAAVRNVLDESYAVLSEGAARLYRRLGLLPVRVFEARIAAVACEVPLEEAEQLVDALVEANLIEDIGPDAYRFHDLVRLHARERGGEGEDTVGRRETLQGFCTWSLATAAEAQRLLSPLQFTLPKPHGLPPGIPRTFHGETDALDWLDGHRSDLMSAVRIAHENQWNDTAWQLVDALWPLFHRLRYYELWIEAHELGLEAAQRAGNATAERQMLNSGAIGLSAAGRSDDAIDWYTASLRAARAAGDTRDEGQALHGIGLAHREAGRFQHAKPLLHEAIEVWKRAAYRRGTALSRIILGEIALAEGDQTQAVEQLSLAHETLTAVDDSYDAARALSFLGRAHAAAGDPARGTDQLRTALTVFESAGATHWQARTWEMLAECARDAGDTASARDGYQRSRSLYALQSPRDARRLGDLLDRLDDRADPQA